MEFNQTCSECGTALPANAPDGLCPRCLANMVIQMAGNAAGTIKIISQEPQITDPIGCYKLLEKIVEGGFGVVYVAEQREPVKRRVALKVIELGMDTRQVVARFEAERQALALMDHPNIAKGSMPRATEQGRPFFVMELVRGIKMTDYCDQNRLSTRNLDPLLRYLSPILGLEGVDAEGEHKFRKERTFGDREISGLLVSGFAPHARNLRLPNGYSCFATH